MNETCNVFCAVPNKRDVPTLCAAKLWQAPWDPVLALLKDPRGRLRISLFLLPFHPCNTHMSSGAHRFVGVYREFFL